MEDFFVAKDNTVEGLLSPSQNVAPVIQKSSLIIKTITKKVPRKAKRETISLSDGEGSLAVINLNEADCNAEEKLIKNNLTVITNYLKKPEGQMHYISADMKSVSVPANKVLQNEEESVDTTQNDVYNIQIDEGCEIDVKEENEDDDDIEDFFSDLKNNPEGGRKIKVDKDDPCSRLHFVKFLKKDGEPNMKIWQCGICGAEFKHQYTLLRHVTMHTDERNYICNVCGKTFRLMSTLSQHKAIHKTARPYVCGVCKKSFSRVSTLISHKKIHFEEKRHKCSLCNKTFHQKGNLKNHFFTHTDERPFKCDICEKGFNQLSNLACHKSRVHVKTSGQVMVSNNKYKCSCCNMSFFRRAQLYQHEEHSHGIENIFSSNRCNKLDQLSKPILRGEKAENIKVVQTRSTRNFVEEKCGIMIDIIDTEAMTKCRDAGRVPYALFKPLQGSLVLVKVCLLSETNHMLVPATAEELRVLGKFTVTPQAEGDKSVQVQIPVVAWIIQSISPEGEVRFDIKPPSNQEQQVGPCTSNISTQITTKYGSRLFVPSKVSSSVDRHKKLLTQHFILSPSSETIVLDSPPPNCGLPCDQFSDEEKLIQVDCPKAEDLEYSQELNLVPVPLSDDLQTIGSDEILELSDCIQYLRPTGVTGEYELLDTIETNEPHQMKTMPDGNTYLVDPSQFSNLMGMLQLAGCELNDNDEQELKFDQT